MEELVSIIMPNYNGGKYLKETLESVLAQTYTNWELLFVDDCSTDNSLEIINEYQARDERIKIFKKEKNTGAAQSRNYALREAKGRWIAFLDSDDLWREDKLEKQINFMKENECAFSFSWYEVINAESEKLNAFCPNQKEYTYKDILKHCSIGCLTAVYDREIIGIVYMPVEAIKREDFACWLSILRNGKTAKCLPETLAFYRVHSNSVSSNKFKMIKWQWNVYRKVERLSFIKSCYYMAHWAIKGVLKYR